MQPTQPLDFAGKRTLEKDPKIVAGFSNIFNNKDIVGPIAEKAVRNYTIKSKNEINRLQRIHYFAIGHSFKQIDCKTVFNYVLNDTEKDEFPTKFLSLQENRFGNGYDLLEFLKDIRNINSHCVHDFNKVNIAGNTAIISFLQESFELALIQTYIKEKQVKDLPTDEQLKAILLRMFYPKERFIVKSTRINEVEKKEKQVELNERKTVIHSMNKNELIDEILFIEVANDLKWSLNNTYDIFTITAGKYLSFESNLLLITMFLYKNEANHLVPKISGYKRNATVEEKSKRYLFTFFSKKYTSQDVDAEESHLVKFRDLVQYLNHYPLPWSKELELSSSVPSMTNALEDKIIRMEIKRSYPSFANNERFLLYAKYNIWGRKHFGKKLETTYVEARFTQTEIEAFNQEIHEDLHIKKFKEEIESATNPLRFNPKEDAYKIYVKQYVLNKYLPQKEGYDSFKNYYFEPEDKVIFEQKIEINRNTEKLKLRIKHNLLIKSYGRNEDRFLDFAMRFLAEEKYFGEDALFKCYQFYNTTEQNDYLDNETDGFRITKTKREIDNLQYHNGKLVHFTTYQSKLASYPYWDTPFVQENNAIAVKLMLNNTERIVTVQRNLIIYFLEHALYNKNIAGLGKQLLSDYLQVQSIDFATQLNILQTSTSITTEQKTQFKKLLPKRLLHHYAPTNTTGVPEPNAFVLLLQKAEASEERYRDLLQKAIDENNRENFLKKNKGKNFKFRFIRKACHLMYFKETYQNQTAIQGHHKNFHITKDEFNDFSKWMFAFEENVQYKLYLTDLFETKGFFANQAFKNLFTSSTTLHDFYNKTKTAYKQWLKTNSTQKDNTKYTLATYKQLFENKMFFINVGHFIDFLKSMGLLQTNNDIITYQALQNEQYLITDYYYKPILEKAEYKTCGKLYNKLRTCNLEDALLYKMAFTYLKKDESLIANAETKVEDILTQELALQIKAKDAKDNYILTVPFNKIDGYAELLAHTKTAQSYLGLLPTYLKDSRIVKGKDANGNKKYMQGNISYADLNTVNDTLINSSVKFSKVLMHVEQYFMLKEQKQIANGKNRIAINEVASLHNFAAAWKIWNAGKTTADKEDFNFRNSAYHFNLPIGNSYENVLKAVEQKFIKEEIAVKHQAYSDLPMNIQIVCEQFLNNIHNNLYLNIYSKSDKEKIETVKSKYLQEVINKYAK